MNREKFNSLYNSGSTFEYKKIVDPGKVDFGKQVSLDRYPDDPIKKMVIAFAYNYF